MNAFACRLTAITLTLGLALAPIAGAAAQGGEVYRWVDDDGVVHFSDRPVGDGAERVQLRQDPSGASGAEGEDAVPTPADEEPAGAADGEELFAEVPADEGEVEAARRSNCETARERLDRLERAPRLFREGAEGEREYLDDDAAGEALALARAQVEHWCGE